HLFPNGTDDRPEPHVAVHIYRDGVYVETKYYTYFNPHSSGGGGIFDAAADQSLENVEFAQEIRRVIDKHAKSTRNGFLTATAGGMVGAIRNAHLAGKQHPVTKVPFNRKGFPDFKAGGHVRTEVRITQTGNRAMDARQANKKAGFDKTPSGYVWHHHQDGR